MARHLQKLNNVHRVVARELALGIPLAKICEHRALNFKSWRNITTAPLFQQEVRRIESEIEEQIIDQHVTDPTVAELKSHSLAAAKKLGEELDNYDSETGGSASSRIKAAQALLDINGYTNKEDSGGQTVVINLSPEKLANIQKRKVEGNREFEAEFTEEHLNQQI